MPTLEQARAWYPDGDPVHGFDHVLRVYRMAEQIAALEGADLEIVRAAALLHDVRGSETEGGDGGRADHHLESAQFARQILEAEGWPTGRIAAVEHCIRAHRFRGGAEAPGTIEAQVLFDADKLDVLGAIGVIRTVAYDVVVGQPIFAEPSAKFLASGEKEPGEPHSSYHEFLFKLRKVKALMHTRAALEIAEQRHRFMAEFFEQLAEEMAGRR